MSQLSLRIGTVLISGVIGVLAGCSQETSESRSSESGGARHEHKMAHQETDHRPAPQMGDKEITQKNCPVTGEPIDPKVSTVYNGRMVYFCCSACIKKFNKEPAKYLKNLD